MSAEDMRSKDFLAAALRATAPSPADSLAALREAEERARELMLESLAFYGRDMEAPPADITDAYREAIEARTRVEVLAEVERVRSELIELFENSAAGGDARKPE